MSGAPEDRPPPPASTSAAAGDEPAVPAGDPPSMMADGGIEEAEAVPEELLGDPPGDPAGQPVSPPTLLPPLEELELAIAEEPAADLSAPGTEVLGDAGTELAAGPEPAPDEAAVGRLARLPSILESLLFAADRPLAARELAALVEEPEVARVDQALQALAAEWAGRGIQLHGVAGGWQFRTHPQNATWVQRLVSQKPVRLTRSQLETLAIIAYRQPITRPEVDEIRGVDSGGTLKTLLERALVRILGKKEEPGRPLLYGTTRDFLGFFNLSDLRELPTLREFHELSDEHRAQVEALERAAPPGAVEGAPGLGPGLVTPLARVELPEAPLDEDMGRIDQLIEEAGSRARGAAEALGAALPDGAGGRGGAGESAPGRDGSADE